uniref:Uncharacterized protein n=1 Tax=Candidatus Kentrum sp. LPFa TaxID=2126335 RepID=A0A450WFG7_9GAMM|nr:MAG: hypothetical protein BECKLPF1236B_GA0070989_108315 [Candidatus Kentron sp. LPFa]
MEKCSPDTTINDGIDPWIFFDASNHGMNFVAKITAQSCLSFFIPILRIYHVRLGYGSDNNLTFQEYAVPNEFLRLPRNYLPPDRFHIPPILH